MWRADELTLLKCFAVTHPVITLIDHAIKPAADLWGTRKGWSRHQAACHNLLPDTILDFKPHQNQQCPGLHPGLPSWWGVGLTAPPKNVTTALAYQASPPAKFWIRPYIKLNFFAISVHITHLIWDDPTHFTCTHITSLIFLQAKCSSCRPTNSVNALKAPYQH